MEILITQISQLPLSDLHTAILNSIASDARALADAQGYTADEDFNHRNAIEHTYVSAQAALVLNPAAAELLGGLKELMSDDAQDSARDLYNNEVGRRIAKFIELNGLDESAIDALVLDALRNGDLVVSPNDPRISSQPPRRPTWREPNEWNSPYIPLPESMTDTAEDKLRDLIEDTKRYLNDKFGDYIPDWLRELYKFVKDILSDPLVLDLDGDGIELTPLASSATMFDLDGDGVAERTGWVSPHDGLLVHDANGNGVADGVAELFGSANVDGYDELKTIDANNDGRIDALDPAFADLRVWRDINSDGVSSADEMLTLAQAGIARFNLAYSQIDADVAGNVVARKGSYVRADGTARAMASVNFALDETGNVPVIPAGADLGTLPTLPNLSPGGSALPDLRTAMYFDPVLKAMVEEGRRPIGLSGGAGDGNWREGGAAHSLVGAKFTRQSRRVPADGMAALAIAA